MDITVYGVYESNDTTFQLTFQLTSHEVSSSREQPVAGSHGWGLSVSCEKSQKQHAKLIS